MSAHLRAGAVSRTEDASAAAGGCPQSVESAVLRAFEDASRTRGACFWHRISLPYRRSLFFTPNASEDASRTPGSLFEHGTHIPYHRWPSPVPNARHRGRLPPQRSLVYKKEVFSRPLFYALTKSLPAHFMLFHLLTNTKPRMFSSRRNATHIATSPSPR